MTVGLTARQQAVLHYIAQYIKRRGYPPTLREIGKGLDISSTNAVSDHLAALERKGFITRDPSKSRGIVFNTAPSEVHEPSGVIVGPSSLGVGSVISSSGAPDDRGNRADRSAAGVTVPILGRIAAGVPLLAEENIEGEIGIDPSFTPQSGRLFALRVVGDSMIEAGIFEGDVIIVKAQDDAQQGAIVVALIDGEATVKRFYREGERIRLQPANSGMKPIYVSQESGRDSAIQGVVVSVFRRLEHS